MKMKNRCRRFLSWLLVFAMMLGMMPATVFADTNYKETTVIFDEVGDWETVELQHAEDMASFTFVAPKDGTYIMDYQVNKGEWNFEVETDATSSNALPTTEYRMRPFQMSGHVLEMKKDDAYSMTFYGSESGTYTVTVGVGKPTEAEHFNGFWSYNFAPGTRDHFTSLEPGELKVKLQKETLGMAFFMKSSYAYDEETVWTASSSNAEVISFNRTEMIEPNGSEDFAEYVGYAPIFNLHRAGEAVITITAQYKDREISETFNVTVVDGSGSDGDDEVEEEEEEDDVPSEIYFSTFDQLEVEVKKAEDSKRNLIYNGSDTLKITEDLTIPNYITLEMGKSGLTVKENVKFTVDGFFECKTLVVKGSFEVKEYLNVAESAVIAGTLTAEDGMAVGSNLDVTGALNLGENSVEIGYPYSVNGMDKIETDNTIKLNVKRNFSNVSELTQLLEEAYKDDSTEIGYSLYDAEPEDKTMSFTESIELETDLNIPNNVNLYLRFVESVSVAEDATLTIDGCFETYRPLRVSGKLVNNGMLMVYRNADGELYPKQQGSLTIDDSDKYSGTGRVRVRTDRNVSDLSDIIRGLDHSKFEKEKKADYIIWKYEIGNGGSEGDTSILSIQFSNLDDLAELLTDDDQSQKQLNYTGQGIFTIDKKLPVVPENVVLNFGTVSRLVIESDVEVTINGTLSSSGTIEVNGIVHVNGELWSSSVLEIKGKVINSGKIAIWKKALQSSDFDGSVVVIDTAGTLVSNAGSILEIESDSPDRTINSVLAWTDFSSYDVTEKKGPGGKMWELKYVGNLEKLGTPTDLHWGIEYSKIQNYNDPNAADVPNTDLEMRIKPGAMSWKTALEDQAKVAMKLYLEEADGNDTVVATWGVTFDRSSQPAYRTADWFMVYGDELESGRYYFTVQSIADGINYRNSDIAESPVYSYQKPTETLEPCTNAVWVDRDVEYVTWSKWNAGPRSQYKDAYQVEFWYSDTKDGEYKQYNSSWDRRSLKNEKAFEDLYFDDQGPGYYKFRVRALTNNVEMRGNGAWSELSPALNIRAISKGVTDDLDTIMMNSGNAGMTDAAIRAEVQKLDSKKLRATLLTDTESGGATDTLSAIEKNAGGPASVVVNSGASSFDATKISVVGANLNKNATASNAPISLVLDQPDDPNHVIPAGFSNSVGVKFSMTLTDVTDPKKLEVPVKITLPVPANINPEFLVIVHYHMDGSHEIVWPFVYEKNGETYADFVLTSFSDFTLAEEVPNQSTPDGPQGGGNIDNLPIVKFSDLQALKAEIDKYDTTERILSYDGTSKFVLNEDLTVPSHLALQFEQQDLEIISGKTLTANNWIACENLIVNGTLLAEKKVEVRDSASIAGNMTIKNGMWVGSALNVNGTLTITQFNVTMGYPSSVSGWENIFSPNKIKVSIEHSVANVGELAQILQYAENNKNPECGYFVWIKNATSPSFIIQSDMTVPENVRLQLGNIGSFVVDTNAKLTNNGMMEVHLTMNVLGKLENNGELQVQQVSASGDRPQLNGILRIENTGTYLGDGELKATTDPGVLSLSNVLYGFDLTKFNNNVQSDAVYWWLNRTQNLQPLGTPTDLEWGIEYRESGLIFDPVTGNVTGAQLDKLIRPGSMSWKTAKDDQAWVEMKIYRDGQNTPVATWQESFGTEFQPEYRSSSRFMHMEDNFITGDYYFTVQSIGDGIRYANSGVATSGLYHYVKPTAKLDSCTNLAWENRNDGFIKWSNWDMNSNLTYVDGYQVEYYYSATENGQYEQFDGSLGRGQMMTERPFDDFFAQKNGIGYYRYKVKTLSSDIEEYGNSEWSDFSPILYIGQIPTDVTNNLTTIIGNVNNQTTTVADAVKEVQQMSNENIKKALLTDSDNTGATKVLADLESKTGASTKVSVTASTGNFSASDISIVGASLNTKTSSSDPITLIVGDAQATHVIPGRFNSAVSVRFSMTLGNVPNPKNLEVPVKITLPIPDDINPNYLVIIHYDSDGGHELIYPYAYSDGNKWYADFVLTSFSEFAMTEEHNLEKVARQEATYTSTGNIEHYKCSICGKLFNNAYGSKELTLADVTIPKKNNTSSGTLPNDGGGGSTSGGKKKPTLTASAVIPSLPSYVVTGQWTVVKDRWRFTDNFGSVYKNKWAAVHNPYANQDAGQAAFDWFFFDENGFMMTGWVLDAGRWYYLNPVSDGTQGRMFTGWQLIDGKWYYLNPISDGTKGAMITDAWIDNYYVDANGVWDETKTK